MRPLNDSPKHKKLCEGSKLTQFLKIPLSPFRSSSNPFWEQRSVSKHRRSYGLCWRHLPSPRRVQYQFHGHRRWWPVPQDPESSARCGWMLWAWLHQPWLGGLREGIRLDERSSEASEPAVRPVQWQSPTDWRVRVFSLGRVRGIANFFTPGIKQSLFLL